MNILKKKFSPGSRFYPGPPAGVLGLHHPDNQLGLLSMESWAAAKKSFKLVWSCHQLLSRFLATGHWRLSVNDKGDNEIIPGSVHRSPGIYLKAKDNPGNPQVRDRRWRLWVQSSLQIAPYLQMWLEGLCSTSEMEKEGKRERMG